MPKKCDECARWLHLSDEFGCTFRKMKGVCPKFVHRLEWETYITEQEWINQWEEKDG